MSGLMRSLHSSVGSKSSNDRRNLDLPNSYNQDESTTALRSSWIRRLHLKLPPLQAQPPSAAQDGSPPPAPATAAVPSSACTTGSGVGNSNTLIFAGHRNTISTVESRTPASISNLQSAFFFRRLLNFHSGRSGLEEENPSCSFSSSGFGPFQVRTRRSLVQSASAAGPSAPPSCARLTPAGSDCLGDPFLDCKEAAAAISPGSDHHQQQDIAPDFNGIGNFGFNVQDSLPDLDKLNYANYGTSIPFSRNEEEEEGMNLGFRQSNWFFREENFVDDGHRSSSFQLRRVAADDHDHRSSFRLSSFFQFRPSPVPIKDMTKKHEYLRESSMNPFLRSARDECLFGGPPGDANKMFIDSDPASSHNLNRPRPLGDDKKCSRSSKSSLIAHDLIYDAPDQRMYEHGPSADPFHCSAPIHGIKYISRSRGGTAYHDGRIDNSASCRTILQDLPLMHHNIGLRQPKRQVPAFPHEPEEPFKRSNAVSASFLEFPVSRSNSRKRYTDIDEFVSMKFRKLGATD